MYYFFQYRLYGAAQVPHTDLFHKSAADLSTFRIQGTCGNRRSSGIWYSSIRIQTCRRLGARHCRAHSLGVTFGGLSLHLFIRLSQYIFLILHFGTSFH
jgi:hypothetical protein